MHRRVVSLSRTLALLLLVVASPSAHADAIHFNTDTGVMTIVGQDTTSFFGLLAGMLILAATILPSPGGRSSR